MKKKTFIVQLLDSKKPSRKSFTQVEDANFYSNDTDASLVFIPHEDTFEFQTAKVVMYNRGDESLVERDAVVTTENGRKVASYELPAEIIAHWGDWTAQPVFNSGGEIYSGAIVPFSVIRYLMHERPATLTEIVTVTEFIQQSQALVDDMEQAEVQRVSAETSRLSAEAQRVSAESSRVSAEAQRKIDHANRNAELDGKADKVALKNLIENGDFIDGVKNIQLSQGARIENQKLVYAHGTSGSTIRWFTKRLNTDLYYFYIKYNTNETTNAYQLANNQGNVHSINSSSTFHSHRRTYQTTAIISIYGGQNATHDLVVDYFVALNLTETFGAGNEPTKEEMDELIKITGYIDGEYALNNKEMLVWTLALIRRNKNAIVALGGA